MTTEARAMSEKHWRIGELAEATGLTVRTLHHYDEIGLLSPSERTEAGHRRYGAADVRLLYRIVALRGLGLGLDEIRAQVYEPEVDARTFLKRHVERVERRLELERDLRDRLARVLEELDRRDEPSAEELFDILEVMRWWSSTTRPSSSQIWRRDATRSVKKGCARPRATGPT